MAYDYSELLGKIKTKYGTNGDFADAMGFSLTTLGKKLNQKVGWKQEEMYKACRLLGVAKNKIPVYFFKEKV